ncbi:MAG TPA: hydantoinase/oxoprolinase family protein, partial [Ktedonobacterales bacterium]|nr:hydantoinase/oxoprolinase family protein [Ktedonobacterales bacterium]
LSGPAAGVIGAFRLAQQAGFDQIITLDIGGTSTDVALCPGEPVLRTETEIDGLPLRVPVIDINTVGAGGGSLARIDAGGALRVGPQSAGANPGPIVYGRGGQTLTVTDANALLGRIDPAHFLGGAMALDLEPARQALDSLAGQMDITPHEAAQGIVAIANANIVQAVRRVSVERGYDPADFTLVAFGGAGPLHACEVADQLGIRRVLMPRYPGVLCAYGLLTANIVHTYSRTAIKNVTDETLTELHRNLGEMIAVAQADLRDEGLGDEQITCFGSLDMRYRGQSYELTVPFTEDVVTQFHAAHRRRYGFAVPQRAVEAVTLRVQAVGTTEKPASDAEPCVDHVAQPASTYRPPFGDTSETIAVFERDALTPGARFSGPALIVQLDCTTFVPVGWDCVVDGYRNIIAEYGG